jgi:hypothetical protein
MSPGLAKRAVEYTVERLNRQTSPSVLPSTVDAYVKWIRGMGNNASDSFRTYPVLYLPPDYDMEEEAVIQQSGQHRAAALIQLFSQKSDYTGYTKKLFHAGTVSVRADRVMYNC